jgi:hypothetical protein
VAAMPPFCCLNNETFIDKLRVTTAINIFKKKNKNKRCLRVNTYIRTSYLLKTIPFPTPFVNLESSAYRIGIINTVNRVFADRHIMHKMYRIIL